MSKFQFYPTNSYTSSLSIRSTLSRNHCRLPCFLLFQPCVEATFMGRVELSFLQDFQTFTQTL